MVLRNAEYRSEWNVCAMRKSIKRIDVQFVNVRWLVHCCFAAVDVVATATATAATVISL